MFRFVCVLMFVTNVEAVDPPMLSILKHNDSLYCISTSNSSSAITWDTGYEAVSYSYYDISKNDLPSYKWTLEKMLNLGPILDYRWERLPLGKTCIYKIPTPDNFKISVSMQGTTIVDICNDSQHNCHKIKFESNGPRTTTDEKREKCENYKRTPAEGRWLHFTISANPENIYVKQYGFKNYVTINRGRYFGRYLIIDGKWKLHSANVYSPIDWNQTDDVIWIINDEQTENVCFGLFVHACQKGELYINLYDNHGNHLGHTINTKAKEWEELQVCGKVPPTTVGKLSFASVSQCHFYVADIMRKFSKNDVRITTLQNEKTPSQTHCCYHITSSQKLCTNKLKDYNPDKSGTSCPITSVGSNCIPCQKIFNNTYCDPVPICDLTSSLGVVCSCPSGYKGKECETRCRANYHGFDCKLKCNKCDGSCNHITGECYTKMKNVTCCTNVNASSLSQTSVSVSWDTPITDYQIIWYKIKYWHTNYRGCHPKDAKPKFEQILKPNESSVTLADLMPYSNYTVQITPVLETMLGRGVEFNISTLPADILHKNEIAHAFTHQNGTQLNISIGENCEQIKGPIFYQIYLYCRSPWCGSNDRETKNITYSPDINLTFTILGNTNYTVRVVGYRNSSHEEYETSFTSAPTVPHAIRDYFVSVTKTSVELRWSEPYPPTGMLDTYFIHYTKAVKGSLTWIHRQIAANSSYCRIWKNQICATFESLSSNVQYHFLVRANNTNVAGFGPQTQIGARPEPRVPSPPNNLTYEWKDTTNALVLNWYHPDSPNGRITHFDIYNSQQQIEVYNITEEQLQYRYEIQYDKLNVSSSDIRINVYAYNSIGGQASTLSVSTPPKKPIFLENPISSDVAETSFKIQIPPAYNIEGNNSILYIIITNTESSAKMSTQDINEQNVIHKEAKINPELDSWIALTQKLANTSMVLIIGDPNQMQLDPGTTYEVTLLLRNEYKNIGRYSKYTLTITTLSNYNYNLFLLLLIIPVICVIIFIFYKRKKKAATSSKQSLPTENTYEELDLPSTNSYNMKARDIKQRQIIKDAKHPTSIKLSELQHYVKECLAKQDFEKQYESFETGQIKEWKCGMKSENKAKNRYRNVGAYDHTRVKLKTINNDPCSDYINANYIDGFDTSKTYIATQGPKSNTINDFWRMIWEENVEYIVMIANIIEGGKKKVEKYWPDVTETKIYDEVVVTFHEIAVFAEYEKKVLKISCKGKEREIRHLHFTRWPDHGVPFYAQTLAPFLKRILTIPYGKSPIVVHCSAGVGRTGTLILCDICLRMAAKIGKVDVYNQLRRLREQRINMVDNINQYKLVHLVLLHLLVAPDFTIQCTEEMDKAIDEVLSPRRISEQMRYIDETFWQDETMRNVSTRTDEPVVPEKNRFQNIIPDSYARISLIPSPISDKSSSYINAIKVDGFCVRFKFIVTQYPLNNTLGDFWRLVDQYDISVIICLNELDLNDKTCCKFYPGPKDIMQPTPDLAIECTDVSRETYYKINTIKFHSHEGTQQRILKILHLKKWKYSMLHPETATSLLMTYEEMNSLGQTSSTILVTCLDGARASGLFTSLSCLIDKIKMEQICDVCLAVRTVRHSRAEFVRESEQFSFLYTCGLDYVQQFEMYSNFSSRK